MKIAIYALGHLKQGQKNKTEQEYEMYLVSLKQSRKILWYTFEGG